VKPAESFEAADGKELGQLLLLDTDKVRGKKDRRPLEAELSKLVDRSAVLRGARSRFPWFVPLLVEVLRNQVKLPSNTLTPLADFGEEEGRKVGGAFALLQLKKVSPAAAVEAWIAGNPALGDLTRESPWFEHVMLGISTELRAQVTFGVKARAYLGAGVSAADALSDAYMTKTFYDLGDTGTANGLMAMVGANITWQMILVYMQTHGLKKHRWRTTLFEMLTVVTFTKPGIEAHRVASGAEQIPGAAISPLMEMIATKCGELFFEAIPGLVLQLVALLNAEQISEVAITSILISTASTALTATTMFWDSDTDPGARKRNPDWAGIVPDLNRGSAFVVLFMMSALQVSAKAAAVALLAVTNGMWLLRYVIADHVLHFVYRVARNDVVAYVPMPPAASYVLALPFRVIWKSLNDFTGSFSLRLPMVLGGSYWLFNLAMSQVSVFVCVHLYLEHAPGDRTDKVAAGTLWAGAGGLVAGWLTTFSYFVFHIAVPKYRHTLWSWTSGRQMVHNFFLKGKDDEERFSIFRRNLLLWESDIGEEVKAWTAENWARWKEEHPPWFKPESVPDQFIPAADLQQLGHNRKRRGSAAGSVRESYREAGGGSEG
ncbi:hypothetical protein TeGR_g5962, partial [Tetraparma gracilis]